MAAGYPILVIGEPAEQAMYVGWRDRFSVQRAANHLQPQKIEGRRRGMVGIPCTLRRQAGLDHNGTARPSPSAMETETPPGVARTGRREPLCMGDATNRWH